MRSLRVQLGAMALGALVAFGAVGGGCTITIDAEEQLDSCAPGYLRCDGDQVVGCRASGDGFEVVQACGEQAICREARCVSTAPPVGIGDAFVYVDAEPGSGDGGSEADGSPGGPGDVPPLLTPLDIRLRVQVLHRTPGASVDIGICEQGLAAAAVMPALGRDAGAKTTVCQGGLFWRLRDVGATLEATAYRHGGASAAPLNPLLTIAGPLTLDPAEIVELRYQQSETGEGGESAWFGLTATAQLAGTAATGTVLAPKASAGRFGLFNLAALPDAGAAMQGVVSAAEVRGGPLGLELDTAALSSLASVQGELLQGPVGAGYFNFYAADDRVGWMLVPLLSSP